MSTAQVEFVPCLRQHHSGEVMMVIPSLRHGDTRKVRSCMSQIGSTFSRRDLKRTPEYEAGGPEGRRADVSLVCLFGFAVDLCFNVQRQNIILVEMAS